MYNSCSVVYVEVENKIMYHFHRVGVYDSIWQTGNEFVADCDFESCYSFKLNSFNTNVAVNDNNVVSFDYLMNEDLIDSLNHEELVSMIKIARNIIYETSIFKRELALEIARTLNYSNLPSRMHSIWVTDENGINYWLDVFRILREIKLYKVSLTGALFMSSDYLIPGDSLTFGESLKKSLEYWHPDFENIKDDRNEYLFQGKVKIMENIKF